MPCYHNQSESQKASLLSPGSTLPILAIMRRDFAPFSPTAVPGKRAWRTQVERRAIQFIRHPAIGRERERAPAAMFRVEEWVVLSSQPFRTVGSLPRLPSPGKHHSGELSTSRQSRSGVSRPPHIKKKPPVWGSPCTSRAGSAGDWHPQASPPSIILIQQCRRRCLQK